MAELEKQDNGQTHQSKQEIFYSTVCKFMMVLGLTENRACGFPSHCCCVEKKCSFFCLVEAVVSAGYLLQHLILFLATCYSVVELGNIPITSGDAKEGV